MALHNVEKDESSYHCTVCKEARGDGDGFIGMECPGYILEKGEDEMRKALENPYLVPEYKEKLEKEIKAKAPFSVFVSFKNNPPTVDDMRIGGEIAKEFFSIIGPDAEGFPEGVESVTIKRSA